MADTMFVRGKWEGALNGRHGGVRSMCDMKASMRVVLCLWLFRKFASIRTTVGKEKVKLL